MSSPSYPNEGMAVLALDIPYPRVYYVLAGRENDLARRRCGTVKYDQRSLWVSRHSTSRVGEPCVYCHFTDEGTSAHVLILSRGSAQATMQFVAHPECVRLFADVLGATTSYHEAETE